MDDPERKGLKIRLKCSTVSELPSWALQEETGVTGKAVGLLHTACLSITWCRGSLGPFPFLPPVSALAVALALIPVSLCLQV